MPREPPVTARSRPQAQTCVRSFQLTMPEPHTKPAPKADSATIAPGFSRPSRSASASASGIDADDVFATRSS